jgi:hypothetical protein
MLPCELAWVIKGVAEESRSVIASSLASTAQEILDDLFMC